MRKVPLFHMAALLAAFLAAGCAHTGGERLGEAVGQGALPPGTPDPAVILADLAANDAAIENFRASGKFILKSPQLKETLLLPQSTIVFQRPADLSVTGRKLGSPVGRLTCAGDAFLLEVATRHEYFLGERGQRIEGMSRAVSPADIARETFLPEAWGALPPGRVRMVEFDAAQQRAVFEVLAERGRKVHRRVEVTGPPWVARRSELLDDDGVPLAITVKGDYRDADGVRFPAEVRSEFPGEDAFMEFSMKTFAINEPVDAALFDIQARLDDILARDYVPMQEKAPAPARGNGGRLK